MAQEKKPRITIKDLPQDQTVGKEKMKKVLGGAAYLVLGDIKGESLDTKHKDEIEVLSW